VIWMTTEKVAFMIPVLYERPATQHDRGKQHLT
jgi:hypothetical protein